MNASHFGYAASGEKGFYAMSFVLSLFAAVAVQKNVRDVALHQDDPNDREVSHSGAV